MEKKRKKTALGKGLEALFPDIDSVKSGQKEYFQCDIELIQPNKYQPRIKFSHEDLEELSLSIKAQGIIQPLLVRKDETGYELVAGERRLRAAKIAGLKHVPVIVKEISDDSLLEISIIENIQREELNPMEIADAYNHLMSKFGFTQDKLAQRLGKSRPSITNFLRLRNLPAHIKATIIDGSLSMGHARALLGAEGIIQLNVAWKAVMSKGLSVRETEALIKRMKKKKPEKSEKQNSNFQYFSDVENGLSRHYGTKVKIKKKGGTGKIEINFFSDKDLDRLLELLGAK